MYENNSPSPARQSGEEFLRRMLGGAQTRRAPGGLPESCASGGEEACAQPEDPAMPSLAMVYAPTQSFRCLFNPQDALREGTMFRELLKPFEGRSLYRAGR